MSFEDTNLGPATVADLLNKVERDAKNVSNDSVFNQNCYDYLSQIAKLEIPSFVSNCFDENLI